MPVRDPGAWNHFMVAIDTDKGTVNHYNNGVLLEDLSQEDDALIAHRAEALRYLKKKYPEDFI